MESQKQWEGNVPDNEAEKLKKEPKTLKFSEMMLRVNGVYVSEIGNPSNRRPAQFDYDPEVGMQIDGSRITGLLVGTDARVVVKDDWGMITIKELCGEEKAHYIDTQLEMLMYDQKDLYNRQAEILLRLTRVFCKLDSFALENSRAHYINDGHPDATPAELFGATVATLDQALLNIDFKPFIKDEASEIYRFTRTKQFADALPYLTSRLVEIINTQIHTQPITEFTEKWKKMNGVERNTYVIDNVLDYKSMTDLLGQTISGRFGDDLAVAVSQIKATQEE